MKHVVVAVMAASGIAHADELTATLGEPLFEASHTVEIRIADGVATYKVQRRFANPGKRADEASLAIDLPYGAAATGLRIRARDRWYDGDLMERERAAALYQELTGLGAYNPRDPALLQWMAADKLHLQVFPVFPGQVSTVEYTLTVPTRYAGGRYWLSYPRVAAGGSDHPEALRLATPLVTVWPAWPTAGARAPITIDGKPAASGAPIALAPAAQDTGATTTTPVFATDAPEAANDVDVAAVAIAPPPIATWTARFGRVVASNDHAFARLEVDVAPQLAPLPRGAQVVFVVDASFSVGAAHLAAQLAVIRAYLSYVPDAQVEVIVVRRHATRRFGAFVSAKAALAALAGRDQANRGAFALGNGSAIDEGARLAAAALAGRTGPRRIVITTDELFRDALSPERALAAFAELSPDTVVHVVVPTVDGEAEVTLTPADDDRFDGLATRHHGIHVALHGIPATGKALAPVVLDLVRPTKIDHLTVTGVTTDVTALHEGDGLRIFEGVTSAPDRISIAGTLWSDPIRAQVAPLAGFSRQTAAFVFGADKYNELSDEEMMAVAMMGGAVSPVTSYVAAEPGTRPSTIGLPDSGGFGVLGAGRGSGMGYGVGGGALGSRPDLGALIDTTACEDQVKPAATWRIALDVETTRDEIVDVIAGEGDAMTACVIEAAWRVRLDPAAFKSERETFHVALGAAAGHVAPGRARPTTTR